MPPSDDQKRVAALSEKTENLTKSKQQIVEETMDGVVPAQEEDYSGSRLNPAKAIELYDRCCRLMLRGVESPTILSRSLGVTRQTIYTWQKKFDTEMRRRDDHQSVAAERHKLFSRISEIEQALWHIQTNEATSQSVKVSLLNSLLNATKLRFELSTKDAADRAQNLMVSTRYDEMTQEDAEEFERTLENMSMILQGGKAIPPEGYISEYQNV